MSDSPRVRRLSSLATGAVVYAMGWVVSLVGDACHVASGTTEYLWAGVPTLWRSGIWFPFVVGLAVLGAARAGIKAQLPVRMRRRRDIVTGIAAVLALYALTASLRGQPHVVAITLCAGVAYLIWSWWDPSTGALLVALGAAVIGPLVEMAIMASGAARYADDANALGGVAPWLPCLYFGAGSVASGLWRVVQQDGEA